MAALGALRDYDGPARPYADHLRARAWWALDKKTVANAVWDSIGHGGCATDGPSPLEVEIRIERATLLASTDPAGAAEQLLALPPDAPRWAAALAHLRDAGSSQQAEVLERRLLIEFPDATETRALEAQLGSKGVAARLDTVDHQLGRLRRLFERHANVQAAAESSRLISQLEPDDPRRCEVLYIQGRTARKRRRYRDAKTISAKARKACDGLDAEIAQRAALTEVQVHAILGDVRRTKRVVKWMLKKHSRHRFTDDARFLLAEVLERRGQRTAARRAYAAVASTKDADHAGLAEWRLAWRAILADKYTLARPRLERLVGQRSLRPEDRERAHYWLARISERKRPNGARDGYVELAKHPSFYGWLALDRLRTFRPRTARIVEHRLTTAATATIGPSITSVLSEPDYADARAYARAGRPDLAAWSIKQLTCGNPNPDALLAVAVVLDALGQTPEAQAVLRRHPQLLAGPMTANAAGRWRVAYSRPFGEDLRAAAAAEKIDELLLTGLVREESTFEPTIVSWAGAVGLAQLMPATAKSAYRQVFRGPLDVERLTEPKLNVRLGAHVLKQGIRSFGHPVLAMGAYNGGHGLVRKFLPRKAEPFERWIENFGVKETRRYMKRVTETWGVYRLLYDRKDPFLRLPKTIARRR